MSLSFHTKVNIIVGAAALAFVGLLVGSTIISRRVQERMDEVQTRYLPRLELAPRLETEFETLRRAFQDAASARDPEALAGVAKLKTAFLKELSGARDITDPVQATALRNAFEDYYAAAFDVCRRIVSGETGEALVRWMGQMQAKQARAADVLKETTAFDRSALGNAFSAAAQAQTAGNYLSLAIIVVCLIVVVGLSGRISRGMLQSLEQLTQGLQRFAAGEFQKSIPITSADELGTVAEQANRMAASLMRLGGERDRADWIKTGHSSLVLDLRGELEPADVASRATVFLTRYLDAVAGALYTVAPDGTLRLAAQVALTVGAAPGDTPVEFRRGEGLVGQAALSDAINVVKQPPPDYLRVRSALGEAVPQAIVLVPFVQAGRVGGVLELALLRPLSDAGLELLTAVRDTVAIALAVARARAAMRDLLAETQRQAERLASQEEELRAINEELQTQQEELRQSNTELGRQARELEQQRSILEQKNGELDDARRGLEHKASELATVSAYKSQFLANMSHELRTPLNSMLLLSNLLAENEAGNLTTKQVEYSRTVYAAGKDLLALINQVLDLAKIESGKQEAHNEPCPLQDVVDHLGRVFEPLARNKGLAFSVAVDPGVPPQINTDRRRLEQVLTNLLGNAVKFTQRGGVTLRVGRPAATLPLSRPELGRSPVLAFTVTDTGLGISPQDRERVFAPFEQVDGATDRSFGGTGLGLSIARQLAELLGGELQLESSLGQGSTFTFVLPEQPPPSRAAATTTVGDGAPRPAAAAAAPQVLSDVATGASSSDDAAGDAAAAAGDGAATLLLIEDDSVFSTAFADIIREQGLECLVASKGQDGLRLARERRPRGIILDVRLPDIDGWTVMQALRADPATAGIPVHFVSALDAADRGLALGAVGYVSKPATHRDLLRVVESLAPKLATQTPRLLVVEDDIVTGESLVRKLSTLALEVHHVTSARHALEALRARKFHCMILDLSLPDMDGLQLLRSLQEQSGGDMPSVVVYTARALSKAEVKTLEAYTEAVVVKEGLSTERLVDEVRLFVRRLKEGVSGARLQSSTPRTAGVKLTGKTILIVDDDMRALYALSAALRAKGASVLTADNGQAALAMLAQSEPVDAVLMDIMMPEMDGYEAMRRIRVQPSLRELLIVALTAKAMAGDEQKCLEAGASAYLPKPVDADRLISLLAAKLNQAARHAS